MNGRFRRDLPRKTDLKAMCDKEFEQIILNHNLMPRKCLKAKSPIEACIRPEPWCKNLDMNREGESY